MDSKMSVGLDTPLSIGLTGQNWIPTPSPTLKLNTPTLEPLQVDNSDGWNNPLSAQTPGLHPQTSNPLTLSTGLTPRFSPGLGGPLASPGVSGEIANVQDSSIQNTSLSDLFRCNEYPFSSAAPPTLPMSATTPASRLPFRPPQTPSTSQPQQKADANVPPKPPATSQPYVSAFPRPPSHAHPTAPTNPTPNQSISYPQNPQPPHQSMGSAQVITPTAPHSNYPYQVQQNPSAPNGLPPRPMSGVAPQAQPGAMPHNAAAKQAPKPVDPGAAVAGHRSVLGSGIVSTAVQEAQVRARMKAESFAKDRKRKRTDTGPVEKPEKLSEDDSKLSPDQLKQKRYQRRLALNRESAAVSRVRRREYVKLLEEQLVNAEKERVNLATQLSDMRKQHTDLQDHLRKLEASMSEGGDN